MRYPACLALLLMATACGGEERSSGESSTGGGRAADSSSPALAPAAAPVPKGRFAPRDECGSLEGSGDFRARLVEAVRLRDADAVTSMADEGIKLDFGGGGGIAELRQDLRSGPELWRALDVLLTLGCAANDQGGLTIPWLFDQDIGDADPYASMLVMGEDVPVLAEPRSSAEPVAEISWDLAEAVSHSPNRPFSEVKLPDGRTGFVESEKLRAVIDYRLLASRVGGRWKMTALIAGD